MTIESFQLPFVTFDPHGRPNLWNPQGTGDWARDCAIGREYAEVFLAHMRSEGAPIAFPHVVEAMPSKHTGVEVGFLTVIASAAISGPE